MQVRGYMAEAEWDGETLTVRGTNRVGRMALGTQDDLVLDREQIERVTVTNATAATNGNITVYTAAGQHVMHFRRKHQESFEELANALDADTAPTGAGRRQKISETGSAGCPKCGGQQFKAKRSVKGKMVGGLLSPKTQVKCLACGAMYRRG